MAGLVIAGIYDYRIDDCGDDRRDSRHVSGSFLSRRDRQGEGRRSAPRPVPLRDVIDQHRADKGKYPETIQALVSAGYLRRVPTDPITGGTSSWQEMVDQAEGGMVDVFSGSELVGTNGVPYNQW